MSNESGNDPALNPARLGLRAAPRVLTRLLRLTWRYPWRFTAAIACAAAAALFNLVTPLLLGRAIDQAHSLLAAGAAHAASAREALWASAGLIVLACAIRGVLTGAQGYLGENLAQRVGYDLRLAFFDQLQRLSFSFHDQQHSGDLIARGMLDLEGVRAFLESGVLRVITLLLLVGAGVWRLLHVDVQLGLLAMSFVPFVVWRATRMGVLLRLSWQRLQQLMSNLTLAMEENLQGMRVVRAFGAHRFELDKFDAASRAALALANLRITIRMRAMSVMNTSYYLSMLAVLWVGGRQVAAGTLTVGLLTEVLTFMTLLQQPVRQVGMIVNSSARAASSGARLFEVMDLTPEVCDAPDARDLVIGEGVLCFEGVSFSYRHGARPALSDVSFELRPGCTLGIVGAPGSGKSTLAQLISRFYDITEGRITIDGQDIRGLTLNSLRRSVSLIQQEAFLFDTSVHHNAAYAEPQAHARQVVEAAQVAHLHTHVDRLPHRYDTRVGERGVALSGGQRQRLSITRGLVSDPMILVFDDATSAIDASTEQQLRTNLRKKVHDKGTLIIAHRLSSLAHADEILVFDAGRVVERGTHDQLLAMQGHYAALWRLQTGSMATSAVALDQAALESSAA